MGDSIFMQMPPEKNKLIEPKFILRAQKYLGFIWGSLVVVAATAYLLTNTEEQSSVKEDGKK